MPSLTAPMSCALEAAAAAPAAEGLSRTAAAPAVAAPAVPSLPPLPPPQRRICRATHSAVAVQPTARTWHNRCAPRPECRRPRRGAAPVAAARASASATAAAQEPMSYSSSSSWPAAAGSCPKPAAAAAVSSAATPASSTASSGSTTLLQARLQRAVSEPPPPPPCPSGQSSTWGPTAQQDAAQAAAPARVARAKEARAPAAQAAATPLVESDSLILSGVSGSYNTKLVQDSVDALMSGYIRAEGVTAVVEEIPSRGQKLDEFRQALKIPVAGAQGAASSTTGGDAEMADRTAGGADSPTRRVIVRFAGKEADVEVARSAFIGYAAFLREALRWVVGDNLTPAGRTARRAVFRDFKTLEAGGMRPRWLNGAQISVMPPGERVPRLCTAEDVRRCAGEQEGARNVNPDQ
ncbi:hypothetical protein PLESTM_000409200 [Pleodorina starrii]|nr:hypothetical protein PLESTM_000409200 [Pleodorina starrii]